MRPMAASIAQFAMNLRRGAELARAPMLGRDGACVAQVVSPLRAADRPRDRPGARCRAAGTIRACR
jgi:hypothetical protein